MNITVTNYLNQNVTITSIQVNIGMQIITSVRGIHMTVVIEECGPTVVNPDRFTGHPFLFFLEIEAYSIPFLFHFA